MLPWKYALEMVVVFILVLVLQVLAAHTVFSFSVNLFLWVFSIPWLISFYIRLFKASRNSEVVKMLERLHEEEERRELIKKLVRK